MVSKYIKNDVFTHGTKVAHFLHKSYTYFMNEDWMGLGKEGGVGGWRERFRYSEN